MQSKFTIEGTVHQQASQRIEEAREIQVVLAKEQKEC